MKKLLITILACLICLQALMPCFAFEELSKGSKGDAVVELQNRLNELGYSVGNADGDFGGKTEKAIEMFQSDNGLTVTGMVDDDTYSKLFPASADSEAVTDNTSDTQEEMKNDNERQIETGNPKVVDVLAYSVGPAILLDNNEIYTVKYNEDSFVFSDVVSATDYGDNIIATRADGSTFVYRGNGTLLESNRYELDDDWTDMALVADGMYHAVGLKKDGTWISAGEYRNHECDVDNWKDIVAIAAGNSHTIGLKADGTVVAVGQNDYGQCDVSGWKLFKSEDEKESEYKAACRLQNTGTWDNINNALNMFNGLGNYKDSPTRAKWCYGSLLTGEKSALQKELANLKGLFTGRRRKEIEARLAQIESELK